ncbi:PIF1-like helicase-domain-containing protein, partial [Catenaria anguillulae PL171]
MPDLLETYLASIDLPQAIKDFADSTPHIAENPEQLAAFNRLQPVLDRAIANKLDPSETRLFFIQGSSGRGKTYLLNHLINYMFINGGTILPCAFTGIAASSLLHGRTAHGTFAIEIKSEDEQAIQAKIRPNTKRAKFLASVHAIIWDEMAMMDRAGVEAVDRMLRVVRRCDLPFGGVVFI